MLVYECVGTFGVFVVSVMADDVLVCMDCCRVLGWLCQGPQSFCHAVPQYTVAHTSRQRVQLYCVTSQLVNTGISLSVRFVKAFGYFRREILLASTNQINKNEFNFTNNFNYRPRSSPYRAVNTLRLCYKNQSVNAV